MLGNKSALARVVSGQLSTGKQICSGGSPRFLFVKTVKGPLFPSTNQNFYRTCFQNFKGAINLNLQYRIKYMDNLLSVSRKFLEIPGIFCSIGHTISPDAQPKFLTGFKNYTRVF